MKILMAADLYWPMINGVATASRNLAIGMAARGHEVVVIAPSNTGKPYEEMDHGCRIVRTRSIPFYFYQNTRISLTPGVEVKRVLDEFQPDVIHVEMVLGISQAVMRLGRKYDIPIVSTNHAMPENLMDNLRIISHISRPINRIVRVYGMWFHEKADVVTMPTQSAIDMFAESKKIKAPLFAVSNGIDLKEFRPTKAGKAIYEKYGIPQDKPIVTYLGRLDAEKHVPVLVDAFAHVLRKIPDTYLLLVGDGTEREHLWQYVQAYEIQDKVIFTGRVTDEDVSQLHKVSTVFVMPSPVELQSIAMLEAMSSGKPVIGVDAGALKELCHDGENGFLCHKDDAMQMANAIEKILSDETLRQKFGLASLKIARKHSMAHTLDRYEEIYQSLIAKKRQID